MKFILIILTENAPDICLRLEQQLNDIENIDDCVLAVQLDYREHNTLFYLRKVESILFEESYMEIKQKNNSLCYLDYSMILEYCILNAEDILELGEGL